MSNTTANKFNFTTTYNTTVVITAQPVSQERLTAWFVTGMTISSSGVVMITFLMAVMLKKSRRNVVNLLICHELLMELCYVSLANLTQSVTNFLAQQNIFVQRNCLMVVMAQITFTQVSSWSAAFLAINRFVALVFPFHYKRKWVSKKMVAVLVVGAWVITIAANMPLYLQATGNVFILVQGAGCLTRFKGNKLELFWNVIGNYVPLSLTGGLYLFLTIKMRNNGRSSRTVDHVVVSVSIAQASESLQKTLKRRYAVARTLFISWIAHAFCLLTLPVFISYFPTVYAGNRILQLWLGIVPAFAYSVNPIIFFLTGADVRSEVRALLKKVCFCRVSNAAPLDLRRDVRTPQDE